MTTGPLSHTSLRLSHLMSLLELRHVEPDEALHGKKQEVCQCEIGGRGRAQARALNYPRPLGHSSLRCLPSQVHSLLLPSSLLTHYPS